MNENEMVLDPGSGVDVPAAGELSGTRSNDGQAADLASGGGSAQTVSSGDLNGGNAQSPMVGISSLQETQALQMASAEAVVSNYSDALTHIDYLLSAILFVLVLDFALLHIKSAVRLFVGRSHW